MAIYKPTDTSPNHITIDYDEELTEPIWFGCKIDTNNERVTAYRITIYNENNEQVFQGSSPTMVSELNTDGEMEQYRTMLQDAYGVDVNTGLNGSYLVIPFIVEEHWTHEVGHNQITRSNAETKLPYNKQCKWIIRLYQGANRQTGFSTVADQYYDMIVDAGMVIGSTNNRIQTIPNEVIEVGKFIQPIRITNLNSNDDSTISAFENGGSVSGAHSISNVGSRAIIEAYDATLGHIYPQRNQLDIENDDGTTRANAYRIYELGNDPENLTDDQMVDEIWDCTVPWTWHQQPIGKDSYGEMQMYEYADNPENNAVIQCWQHEVYKCKKNVTPGDPITILEQHTFRWIDWTKQSDGKYSLIVPTINYVESITTIGSAWLSFSPTISVSNIASRKIDDRHIEITMETTEFMQWIGGSVNVGVEYTGWNSDTYLEFGGIVLLDDTEYWERVPMDSGLAKTAKKWRGDKSYTKENVVWYDRPISKVITPNSRIILNHQYQRTETTQDATIPNELNHCHSGVYYGIYNGIYRPEITTVKKSTDTYTRYQTTVRWFRTADAELSGQMMKKDVYCQATRSNFSPKPEGMERWNEECALAGENPPDKSTKFAFVDEISILLNGSGSGITRDCGLIFYTDKANNILYLRPSVYLQTDTRIYGTNANWQAEVQSVNKYNRVICKKNTSSTKNLGVIKVDESRYVIKSFFRDSDEIPVIAHMMPDIDIAIYYAGAKQRVDDNAVQLHSRSFTAQAGFVQDGLTKWSSHHWELYKDLANEGEPLREKLIKVQQTDEDFDGELAYEFKGLEADAHYYIELIISTEYGEEIRKTFAASDGTLIDVHTDFEDRDTLNVNIEYSCDEMGVVIEAPSNVVGRIYVLKREIWENGDEYEAEPLYTPVHLESSFASKIIDYNIGNQHLYEYLVYYKDDATLDENDGKYYSDVKKIIVGTSWQGWTLVNLHATSNRTSYYASREDVWRFRYNVQAEELQQTLSKSQQETLAKYPIFSSGQSNYASGNISGLIGQDIVSADYVANNVKGIDWGDNRGGYLEKPYTQTMSNAAVDLMNQWRNLCRTATPKLLCSPKGSTFLVEISSNSNTIAETWDRKPVSVNFEWVEIDDAHSYSIYQRGDIDLTEYKRSISVDVENGSVIDAPTEAIVGELVTLVFKANEGYQLPSDSDSFTYENATIYSYDADTGALTIRIGGNTKTDNVQVSVSMIAQDGMWIASTVYDGTLSPEGRFFVQSSQLSSTKCYVKPNPGYQFPQSLSSISFNPSTIDGQPVASYDVSSGEITLRKVVPNTGIITVLPFAETQLNNFNTLTSWTLSGTGNMFTDSVDIKPYDGRKIQMCLVKPDGSLETDVVLSYFRVTKINGTTVDYGNPQIDGGQKITDGIKTSTPNCRIVITKDNVESFGDRKYIGIAIVSQLLITARCKAIPNIYPLHVAVTNGKMVIEGTEEDLPSQLYSDRDYTFEIIPNDRYTLPNTIDIMPSQLFMLTNYNAGNGKISIKLSKAPLLVDDIRIVCECTSSTPTVSIAYYMPNIEYDGLPYSVLEGTINVKLNLVASDGYCVPNRIKVTDADDNFEWIDTDTEARKDQWQNASFTIPLVSKDISVTAAGLPMGPRIVPALENCKIRPEIGNEEEDYSRVLPLATDIERQFDVIASEGYHLNNTDPDYFNLRFLEGSLEIDAQNPRKGTLTIYRQDTTTPGGFLIYGEPNA